MTDCDWIAAFAFGPKAMPAFAAKRVLSLHRCCWRHKMNCLLDRHLLPAYGTDSVAQPRGSKVLPSRAVRVAGPPPRDFVFRTGHSRMLPVVCGLLTCVCLGLAGCGGSKQGQRPTVQVTGEVTYKGAPVTRGEVKFIPANREEAGARVAFGPLDAQGRYRLSTYGDGDGAILGNYAVTIESRVEAPPEGKKETADGRPAGQRPKSLVPERYADPQTSRLTAEVKQGSNHLNFTLED
jgi:hypothetical protein